jgi:hypothetical protein
MPQMFMILFSLSITYSAFAEQQKLQEQTPALVSSKAHCESVAREIMASAPRVTLNQAINTITSKGLIIEVVIIRPNSPVAGSFVESRLNLWMQKNSDTVLRAFCG